MNIDSRDALIARLRAGQALEHRATNLELKRSWDSKYGQDLSALANRANTATPVAWLVVGVENDGTLSQHQEAWARKTEEIISQQVNQKLSPVQSCVSIESFELDGSWTIIVQMNNPGDVVYWGTHAYVASGTTSRALEPQEVLELRLRQPGLIDFTRQAALSAYDERLTSEFSADVRRRTPDDNLPSDPLALLRHLGIDERQAARVLFGDSTYRTVVYDSSGNVVHNSTHKGCYGLLHPDFLEQLQRHSGQRTLRVLFPVRGVHEAIANAVAHAAHFQSNGDIIIELHPARLEISNLCTAESKYFANLWFSRSHHTVNALLMETLRIAGHVDELGRGKNLIFSDAIRAGRRPPEVVIENAGRLCRWKLSLFASSTINTHARLLERCKSVYQDEMRALIAVALVFWRNKRVSEIRQYVDGDFASQFAEVLSSLDGPIFYSEDSDQILLTRWARILLGEGKDSKELSQPEEAQLRAHSHRYSFQNGGGEITPADLRRLGQMGDTQSEKSLSSRILKKWTNEQVVERVAHGRYRFPHPPRNRHEIRKTLEDLLEKLKSE